jgi:hypothetical protein
MAMRRGKLPAFLQFCPGLRMHPSVCSNILNLASNGPTFLSNPILHHLVTNQAAILHGARAILRAYPSWRFLSVRSTKGGLSNRTGRRQFLPPEQNPEGSGYGLIV